MARDLSLRWNGRKDAAGIPSCELLFGNSRAGVANLATGLGSLFYKSPWKVPEEEETDSFKRLHVGWLLECSTVEDNPCLTFFYPSLSVSLSQYQYTTRDDPISILQQINI